MRSILKQHTLIMLYSVVFFGLLYGLWFTSGTQYFPEMFIFFFSLIGFYFLLNFLQKKFLKSEKTFNFNFAFSIYLLAVPILLVVLAHLIFLGGSPAIEGFYVKDWEESLHLRNRITEGVPTILNYGSSIAIKAALPFLLLYAFIKEKKALYWIVFIVGAFYTFSLMQKSHIVAFLLPSFVYAVLNKKWLYAVKYAVTMGLIIVMLGKIANPLEYKVVQEDVPVEVIDSLDENIVVDTSGPAPVQKIETSESKIGTILYGIKRRVFVVPGFVVSSWFYHIPKNKLFLYGDGYRLLAKMKGKDHRSYATELYPLIKPANAKRGITGSVNVASFMYDYANFGRIGLVLSGFMLSFLFLLVERLFKNDYRLKLSLNLYPILALSSSAMTTLLFSGGWMFVLLFKYVFTLDKKKVDSGNVRD